VLFRSETARGRTLEAQAAKMMAVVARELHLQVRSVRLQPDGVADHS
jgi:hypothetical protein